MLIERKVTLATHVSMAYLTTSFHATPSGTRTVVTVGSRADFSATKRSRPRAASPAKENEDG